MPHLGPARASRWPPGAVPRAVPGHFATGGAVVTAGPSQVPVSGTTGQVREVRAGEKETSGGSRARWSSTAAGTADSHRGCRTAHGERTPRLTRAARCDVDPEPVAGTVPSLHGRRPRAAPGHGPRADRRDMVNFASPQAASTEPEKRRLFGDEQLPEFRDRSASAGRAGRRAHVPYPRHPRRPFHTPEWRGSHEPPAVTHTSILMSERTTCRPGRCAHLPPCGERWIPS